MDNNRAYLPMHSPLQLHKAGTEEDVLVEFQCSMVGWVNGIEEIERFIVPSFLQSLLISLVLHTVTNSDAYQESSPAGRSKTFIYWAAMVVTMEKKLTVDTREIANAQA
jgi:hypothetical protein